MRPLRVAALSGVVFVLVACSGAGPSAEYAAAREKHAALVAAHPGDAASRPELDEVLALLDRVPETSPDARSARELRERLIAERKASVEQASTRTALVQRAGEAPAWPPETSIGRPEARPPIAVGMRFDDFRAQHGECFEREAGEFRLAGADGNDRPVESWAVSAAADCRARYAAQLESRVLVADGAVVALRRASDATTTTAKEEKVAARRVERNVELVPMAGGGFGVRGADGKVEPLPPGAEVRTLDGKPLPPNAGEARP
jgi:hypothetical protein